MEILPSFIIQVPYTGAGEELDEWGWVGDAWVLGYRVETTMPYDKDVPSYEFMEYLVSWMA
jgi:hypothetical protein